MTSHADAILKLAESQPDKFTKTNVGGRLFSFDLVGFIGECKQHGIPIGFEELSFILSRLDMGTFDGPLTVPDNVAQFMTMLAEPFSPQSVLDPWAGLGDLACAVQKRLLPKAYDAYTRNAKEHEVFQLLVEASKINMMLADPLKSLQSTDAKYDAVIGCPPFGMRSETPLSVHLDGQSLKVNDDYGSLLVLQACRHLTEKGVGIFVIPNSFFFSSGQKVKARHALELFGIRVVAAIELPAGTFRPGTVISTHIIVLERSSHADIFTGRFTDDARQQADLLKNMRERKTGKAAQLGRLVPAQLFRGFRTVELKEQVKEQARRMGLMPYPFSEVVVALNTPPGTPDFDGYDEKPNAVYLPQMAATAAATTQQELPENRKRYFQLVVDPDIADAEFLARILNTPFGQLWRDSLRTGETIPRISKTLLKEAAIYLPPKKARTMQNKVLESQHTLSRLRNELNELESQLWKRPSDVEKIKASLSTVNQDDRFEVWLESMPFPLATVLWVCHTQTGSFKEQYERKINFFEAMVEFLGVIFLSAYSAHHPMWPALRKTLQEALDQGKVSIEMATFGTWRIVVEVLGKQTRRLLGEDEELVFELFKTRNRQLLEALCSKQIGTLVQATNKVRNEMAHTGIVADKVAKTVSEMLQNHIQTVRDLFGVLWEEYKLLLPGNNTHRSGVYRYTIRKVMGTRTPFATETVDVVGPMEDGHLHLKSPSESRALKLLPLVKVMPSPKTEENACYFYNRQQTDGIRFLSYHFGSDAELVEEFVDVAVVLKHLMFAVD